MTPIVTIQTNAAAQNDCCDIQILGRRNPDDLVHLREQAKAAGFDQRRCISASADVVIWTLGCPWGELMDDARLRLLENAIESAGMQVAC